MKISLSILFFVFSIIEIFAQDIPKKANNASSVKGIHHVEIAVMDLEKSLLFYKNAVGVTEIEHFKITKPTKIEKKSGLYTAKREVALLQGANAYLSLVAHQGEKTPSPMPVQGAGLTHLCFQIPNTKPIYQKVKDLGASIVSRGNTPIDIGGYGIQYAYAKDANGIMFEMEHFDKPNFMDDAWIGHIAIVTPDIDRIIAFYTELLGVPPYRRNDDIKNNPKLDAIANIDGLKMKGAWFKTGNMILEIWQFISPETKPNATPLSLTQVGYSKIAFEVGNLASEYKRLGDKNFYFLSKPMKTDGVEMVYLRDPDGNLLLLQEFGQNSTQSIDKLKKLTW
jgi:catechol 2,3-dioxygenase-like lactoylglutathione lyase family enzyme